MRALMGLIFTVILFCHTLQAQDRIREFFEWGEYDSLLVAIPAYFAQSGHDSDSTLSCDHYAYLGVAFFAKGNIADARASFRQALVCRPALDLDTLYVTPEMMNLFHDVQREIVREKGRRRLDDSAAAARESERKLEERRLARDAALRSKSRRDLVKGIALIGLCAGSGAAAIYEYSVGTRYELAFRSAVETGDRRAYERNRDLLQHQNRNILAFSAASLVSGCLASYYGSRSLAAHRMRATVTSNGEATGVAYAVDF